MDSVDIIMPVYNCEKYVRSAIRSVKEQTHKNWHLIIVNDMSEDNSKAEIEKEIKNIKDKVTLINLEENVGVAKSRNIALNESKSKYIAFLDGDDVWKKEKLEKQINYMKVNNYSFTYTNFTYVKGKRYKKVKVFPKYLDYKKALKNTFILTSTVVIDKDKINEKYIKMPDIESEDTATWWNILKNNNIAFGLNENITIYRVHRKGLSFNKIKGAKRTWNLYRKNQNLSFLKSFYFFLNYALNAMIKRIL